MGARRVRARARAGVREVVAACGAEGDRCSASGHLQRDHAVSASIGQLSRKRRSAQRINKVIDGMTLCR